MLLFSIVRKFSRTIEPMTSRVSKWKLNLYNRARNINLYMKSWGRQSYKKCPYVFQLLSSSCVYMFRVIYMYVSDVRIYKRKQESKKTRTRPRKWSRKKKVFSFFLGRFLGRVLVFFLPYVFLIAFWVEFLFSCFLDRFLGRVLVFLFTCFLL